jgi:RNA polymerase sigma factor (sigma-70 family)
MKRSHHHEGRQHNRTSEDSLIARSQQPGGEAACEELFYRYLPYGQRTLRHFARTARLTSIQVAEAEEMVGLAFMGALKAYLLYEPDQGCSFATFLHGRLRHRFGNFLKKLQREERHIDHAWEGAAALEAGKARLPRRELTWLDPMQAADAHEFAESLTEAVSRLPLDQRPFVDHLLGSVSLKEIAHQVGISYYAARRRWEHFLSSLRVQLRMYEKD